MINLGVPEAVAEDRAKALILFAEGDADYLTDDVPSILGLPARSSEQFAGDCAAAFSRRPGTLTATPRAAAVTRPPQEEG